MPNHISQGGETCVSTSVEHSCSHSECLLAATARSQDVKLTGDRVAIPQPPDMSSYYSTEQRDLLPHRRLQRSGAAGGSTAAVHDSSTTTATRARATRPPCGSRQRLRLRLEPLRYLQRLRLLRFLPDMQQLPEANADPVLGNQFVAGCRRLRQPRGPRCRQLRRRRRFQLRPRNSVAFSEATGIAFQGGASFGVYDWNGRPNDTGVLTTTAAQQQTFVTLGFYKRANRALAV